MTRSSSLSRWFSLVWLVFLGFPVLELLGQPRPMLVYLYGLGLLIAFVAVFIWSFFLTPWSKNGEGQAYRLPSLTGIAVSYAVMGLLVPVVGWNGIGMLIYAGAFAGTQLSFVPAAWSILISVVISVSLVTTGMSWSLAGSMIFFTLTAAIGNHVSYREVIVAQRLRRSQQEVVRVAKLAERERIARDLHDLLGHTLSVIVLKSELAGRVFEKDPARANQEIRDVERIARASLQEVRSAVRGYRSAGLEGELSNVRLACEAAGLTLQLYLQPLELEWSTEQTISYVLRECVTNTIRHGAARTLWVSLEGVTSAVRLSIWDDGEGRIGEGDGVRGMRERVAAINGNLELNAEYKGVTATIPLKGKAGQTSPSPEFISSELEGAV